MRLIDADALAHDLEYDVELCAKALDDMNLVGKEREDMQFQKDCKQNCIWYISEQPTVDAIPIEWIENYLRNYRYMAPIEKSFVREMIKAWTERRDK